MKNEDAVIHPIQYLEMLFGRYVNDLQTLEVRRVNYFCFLDIVTAFTAIGAFDDLDEFNKADAMCKRLQEVLDLDFTKKEDQ